MEEVSGLGMSRGTKGKATRPKPQVGLENYFIFRPTDTAFRHVDHAPVLMHTHTGLAQTFREKSFHFLILICICLYLDTYFLYYKEMLAFIFLTV